MADVRVRLDYIGPTAIRDTAICSEVVDQYNKEAEVVVKMFKKIVKTWNRKPRFVTKGFAGCFSGEIELTVGPDMRTKAGKKFMYLNDGTSVRRAVMSNPFTAKSRVRKIGSWAGRGGAVFVSRRVSQPGIKARDWIDEIGKRRQGPFGTNIQRAISRGAKGVFV